MSLLRSTAVVGGLTAISRVLGFVRDVLVAGTLGTGPIADAFFVAFRFPNLFRRFFAEGAFNAAFVPLFSEDLKNNGNASAKAFAAEALSLLTFVLLTFTALAQIFMPWVIHVIAPGFSDDPEKFDLAVLFTRITMPYLLFVSLLAVLSGILNSLGRFAVAAAAPTLLNVVLIAALVFATPYFETPGHVLVWGVALAGVVQFLAVAWGAQRSGMLPRLQMPRLTPRVKKLIALGIPGMIAGGIVQINLVVGQIIASVQDGAVAALSYADRVYQLPLGLIGVAMGVVLLPELSRRLAANDDDGALNAQNRALEISLLLTLPAAVALFVIPLPITKVLFVTAPTALLGASEFTLADAQRTGAALAAFALGLPAFVLIRVFQPGFFARQDTRTPMVFSAINTAVNIALSVYLFLFLKIGIVGIAIATTVAAWINVSLLAGTLAARGLYGMDTRIAQRLPRIVLASLVMGGVLFFAQSALQERIDGDPLSQLLALALLVAAGLASFFLLAHLTGAARASEFMSSFRRKA